MFEQWKERELTGIREQYGKARVLTWGIVAFMGLNVLGSVVMLLDGGGALQGAAILIQLGIMVLAWNMGDYKRRFIKPMMASVEETLPTQGEREEFARQMDGAEELLCPSAPQGKAYPLWLGTDYLYFRLPKRSRVLKGRTLRRIRLAKEDYTVGRGHVRTCYALSLFQQEEKPVWRGIFYREEEGCRALETVRAHLPSAELEDRVAYGKTEEGRKAERRSELFQILLAALLVAALAILAKLLQR